MKGVSGEILGVVRVPMSSFLSKGVGRLNCLYTLVNEARESPAVPPI